MILDFTDLEARLFLYVTTVGASQTLQPDSRMGGLAKEGLESLLKEHPELRKTFGDKMAEFAGQLDL